MPSQPTNADIMELVEAHTKDDTAYQKATDKSLQAIHKNMVSKEDIAEIVTDAIDAYFQRKGKFGLSALLTSAAIVGALTVIFGGFKTLLAWIGYTYIK